MASSDEELCPEEVKVVEEHLADCAQCTQLRDDLKKIWMDMKAMPKPVLPPELAEKTRERCYAELKKQYEVKKSALRSSPGPIPIYVWAVLIVLTVLTMFVTIPVISEIRLDESLSFKSAAVLTLIIQNAVMLFFAPVLIRKYRSRKQDISGFPMNANAS
jgi:hypothetical protein